MPSLGILAVNPADTTCFAQLGGHYGLKRHALFHAQLYWNDLFFLAGPAVGAPMAAICLEKLIALGAGRIVVYGWCGSLNPMLESGDLFVPRAGLSEEGTSVHYHLDQVYHDDSLRFLLVDALTREGCPPRQGQIWTTDAVYRETREKVERYRAQGILAVDMEYTALRSVAAFRQVSLTAVMLVSDELFHQNWAPRFQFKKFRVHSRQMLAKLCAILHTGEVS